MPSDEARHVISRFGFTRFEEEGGFRDFLQFLASMDVAEAVDIEQEWRGLFSDADE